MTDLSSGSSGPSPARAPGSKAGTWALVAGASEGLGEAFSRELAGRGFNLVLVARRPDPLGLLAARLEKECSIQVETLVLDLGLQDAAARILARCADRHMDLVVYNAALAPMGDFASLDAGRIDQLAGVNMITPMKLINGLVPGMTARGKGGIILMASLAGIPGSPCLAGYAASKAFLRVLAQSLWQELKGSGIQVLSCVAGAIRTPGYLAQASREAPGTLDPDRVARGALKALGKRPVHIPGLVNKLGALFLGRLLPFRTAVGIMAKNTADLGKSRAAPNLTDSKEKNP